MKTSNLNYHPTKSGPGRRAWRTSAEALAIVNEIKARNNSRLPGDFQPGAKLLQKAAKKAIGKAVLK